MPATKANITPNFSRKYSNKKNQVGISQHLQAIETKQF